MFIRKEFSLLLVLTIALASIAAVPYNQIQQKSSHNSYQRAEALLDQMTYHRIRSLELDIHFAKGNPWQPVNGDWYVYHTLIIPNDWQTTCHRFSDCLQEFAAFHRQSTQHEVVNVFIDIKSGWNNTGQSPAQFDSMIRSYFAENTLWTPEDMYQRCPQATNLQDTVLLCGWPDLEELRGKYIFAITDGGLQPGTKMEEYRDHSESRVAFAAGRISSETEVGLYDQIFYNLNEEEENLVAPVRNAGYVARMYNLNNEGLYNMGRNAGVNHLGTNSVNYHEDPWSVSHTDTGYPFVCLQGCGTLTEPDNLIGVEVDSGDIWDDNDDFVFLSQDRGTSIGRWEAVINTVNSAVEDFAKGCVMVRAGLADDDQYFAVCRPADNKRLRIQWRDSTGGNSGTDDVQIMPNDTIDQESLTHVAVQMSSSNTCADGYGSQDGINWTHIGGRCFSSTLSQQGLATSSHDDGLIKFLYRRVTRDGDIKSKGDFSERNIGTVREANVFDGAFDTDSCDTDLRLGRDEVRPGDDLNYKVFLRHNRVETVEAGFFRWVETMDGEIVHRRRSQPVVWEFGSERLVDQVWPVPLEIEPGQYRLFVAIDRMLQGVAVEERVFTVVDPDQ